MRGYLSCLFAALVAVCACFVAVAANNHVGRGSCGPNLQYYVVNDGTKLIINGTGAMKDYESDVIAPWRSSKLIEVVIEEGVTTVGDQAFMYCRNITSVSLPSSLTKIGSSVFYECNSLKSVTIPAGAGIVKEVYFHNCSMLEAINVEPGNPNFTSVNGVLFNKDMSTLLRFPCAKSEYYEIPTGTVTISSYTFNQCRGLREVKLPQTMTSIPEKLFYGCKNLSTVDIPSGVTQIGKEAFSGCASLTSVTLPSGVTEIQDSAFSGCSKLASVNFPDALQTIGTSVFSNTGFVSVTFPARLGVIPNYTYGNCKQLKTAVIPEGITKIGSNAFVRCESLLNATIPASVTEIGQSAFGKNQNMNNIYVDKRNPNYADIDGVLFSKDKKTLIQYPGDHSSVYTIPDGVTRVAPFAFQYISNWFWKIRFPSSLTSIGRGAFQDNSGIEDLILPSTIVQFEYECFYNTWIRNVIYLGLHDPDPGDTNATLSYTTRFQKMCVPVDYQDYFCLGKPVYAKNDTFQYLHGQDNECYQAIVCSSRSSGTGNIQRRPSVQDWIDKTSKCATYTCDNTTGLHMTDSCNHTENLVCVEGKCVKDLSSSSSHFSSSRTSSSHTSSSHASSTHTSSSHTSSSHASSAHTSSSHTSSSHASSSRTSSSHTPSSHSTTFSSSTKPGLESSSVKPATSSISGQSSNSTEDSVHFTESGVRAAAKYVAVLLVMVLALMN